MPVPESYNSFLRRLKRGCFIFWALSLVFTAVAGRALLGGYFGWSATCLLLGIVCQLTITLHVGKRYDTAMKVRQNPRIVYWVHWTKNPDLPLAAAMRLPWPPKSLTLHLRAAPK